MPMSVGVIAKLKKLTPELENDIRRVDELFVSAQEKFKGPFLAGDRFTAVDAFFCPVAFRIKNYNLKLSGKSMGYIEQFNALSSMQEWLQLALEEQEMDPMEEQQLDRYAIRIKDLREI